MRPPGLRPRSELDPGSFGYSPYDSKGSSAARTARNMLASFSDLFSEFSRHIAPAYHHDRCERSVHMRLYSMHKREFVLVFAAFSACLVLSAFIGLAGPPITAQSEQRATRLSPKLNSTDLATGPYYMRTPALSSYSQQLWVIAKVETDNPEDEVYDKPFHITVNVQGINKDHQTITVARGDRARNRTRHLHCHQHTCDELVVLHLGYLEYTHYMLTIRFFGLESFHLHYNIKDITFYFKTYNPDFTQIEIWFRFVFLLTTFIVMVIYAHTLRKFPSRDWSIEQRWLSLLLPLLLFYNDPIFPMMFLTNSWIPGMLDAVLQATFLCGLLLFWLCIYHGLRQTERRWLTFYAPKFLVVGALWLSAVIMASWQKCNELHDPTYNYKVDSSDFNGFKVFFLTAGAIYLAYLLLLMLKAYTDLRAMPFFDMRLKFLSLFLMVVVSVTLVLTAMRYGAGVLEDNFVSELSTTYSSSAHFMSLYGLLNFYVYTMAYVYSPAQNSAYEPALTKDNPTLSMINESDEEVVYGSDDDCRRPLNLSRQVHHHDADDSD